MDADKEKLKQIFDSLPKPVQQAILSADIDDILLDIEEKHRLHIDQIGEISFLVGQAMMGLLPLNKFSTAVADRLEITHAKALEITKDVNELIFQPAQETLKGILKEQEEDKTLKSDPDPGTSENKINLFEQRMGSLLSSAKEETPAKKTLSDPYREPVE